MIRFNVEDLRDDCEAKVKEFGNAVATHEATILVLLDEVESLQVNCSHWRKRAVAAEMIQFEMRELLRKGLSLVKDETNDNFMGSDC